MVESGFKRVTKVLTNLNWLHESGNVVKLIKKQKLFITRGHKYTGVFSFPATALRALHRKMLQEGYHIPNEDMFRQCAFVLEVKGMRLPDGTWIKFEDV